MSTQIWARSSLPQLSRRLHTQGITISPPTVGALLRHLGYSLKVNQKRLEGVSHPDRDLQFGYIEDTINAFTLSGLPIISVDAKKKELIGDFKNAGQCWSRKATAVNVHDFPQDAQGRAVPYGIYLPNRKEGFVYMGNSADTSEFAVDCIKRWWIEDGSSLYPGATELLILADSGGSNSCRYHLWKDQLQQKLSNELSLRVTVCHYPTSCSKWNPIEHRLFGPISINWAAEPLQTFAKMLGLIRDTTNRAGLIIKAFMMEGVYQKGMKVSDEAKAALNIVRHVVCPQWNYTIAPNTFPYPKINAQACIGNLLF